MGEAHTPGGPAEADHRLWEPPRDSPVPPQGTTNRRLATEVHYAQQPSAPLAPRTNVFFLIFSFCCLFYPRQTPTMVAAQATSKDLERH